MFQNTQVNTSDRNYVSLLSKGLTPARTLARSHPPTLNVTWQRQR